MLTAIKRSLRIYVELVSTGMGDRLRACILPQYVTKPTRSTQPCIPVGYLNRVSALISWGKGENVNYAGPVLGGRCMMAREFPKR